jgi:hypothetical protein
MVDFADPDRDRAVAELAHDFDILFRLRNARRRSWARVIGLPLPPRSRPPMITLREARVGIRPFQRALWASWRRAYLGHLGPGAPAGGGA